MVSCASLFSQLVSVFNRRQFYQLVVKHRSERYSKGYSSWDHFVSMLFCQLAQAKASERYVEDLRAPWEN